jgi:hypothetical protein
MCPETWYRLMQRDITGVTPELAQYRSFASRHADGSMSVNLILVGATTNAISKARNVETS